MIIIITIIFHSLVFSENSNLLEWTWLVGIFYVLFQKLKSTVNKLLIKLDNKNQEIYLINVDRSA